MRMGVIEEVGGGDGGQSKIRSWRRVIVMRGVVMCLRNRHTKQSCAINEAV